MGIGDLWESIKLGFDERVSLDKFVADFVDENGRTPRVAIDAYMFLFMASGVASEDDMTYPVQAFMSKVFALISLNMPLIVVFDGRYKPNKLRNHEREFEVSYEFTIDIYRNSDPTSYSENMPVVNRIKKLLMQHKIDILQAPGEAEAQCAWLQKFGIVDYVISNDSDSLVFGATHILRNFNRYEPDISTSPKKNQIKPKIRYYVTPVHLSKITSMYGLDTSRLIFLATLRGGDYSSGVDRIGIINATKLALCGTDYIKNQKLSKVAIKELKLQKNDRALYDIPDFATMVMKCFISPNCQHLLQSSVPILNKDERESKLRVVIDLLNKTIQQKARLIFNRSFSGELTFDGELMLLYLFPIVCSAIYKFLPCSLSGDEDQTCDISIPHEYQGRIPIAGSDQITRINDVLSSTSDDIIGYSHLEYENSNGKLTIKQQILMVENDLDTSQQYSIPHDFDFYIKYIIIKILNEKYSTLESIQEIFHISKLKVDDGIQLAMIKYNAKALYARYPSCIENSRKGADITTTMTNYVWLPLNLVRLVNPTFVKTCEDELKKETERKNNNKNDKKSIQKSTLDMFDTFQKSPSRKSGSFNGSLSGSPTKSKIKPSPTKTNKSPMKRKRSILPGQTFLDSFIGLTKNSQLNSSPSKTETDEESPTKKLKSMNLSNNSVGRKDVQDHHNNKEIASQYGPPIKFDIPTPKPTKNASTIQKDIVYIDEDSTSEENTSDFMFLPNDPFGTKELLPTEPQKPVKLNIQLNKPGETKNILDEIYENNKISDSGSSSGSSLEL